MSEKLAYTVVEFAKLIGVSRAMVYRLWGDGKGPKYFKLGKRTLIKKSDAEIWVRKQ